MAVNSFDGPYRFLSNFWPNEVTFDDETYPSIEHAYQAAKTLDPEDREKIRLAPTAAKAKKFGKVVTLRPDWNDVRLDIMKELLQQKFSNPTLRDLLIATGDEELIEGNWWGDVYWGKCRGKGENHLGRLLMEIRELWQS